MQFISKSIKEGALAFLAAEYRLLVIFAVIASALLFFVSTLVWLGLNVSDYRIVDSLLLHVARVCPNTNTPKSKETFFSK